MCANHELPIVISPRNNLDSAPGGMDTGGVGTARSVAFGKVLGGPFRTRRCGPLFSAHGRRCESRAAFLTQRAIPPALWRRERAWATLGFLHSQEDYP